MRHFTLLFLALLFAVNLSAQDLWDGTTASSFAGGSGTETDPYQIRTGAELMYFVSLVDNGDDFSGKTVKMMNDIDMNGNNFSISTTFAGTFDGGSHFLTMELGVTSNKEPFSIVTGRIHHLGMNVSMLSQYKRVYYGSITIVNSLGETGILEDCHYTVQKSASIFSYQPALVVSNRGIIRNCYAGGSFNTYGGYSNTDGSLLVRDNFETGVIENCYAYVNNGMTNYYYQPLPIAYTDQGIITHNSTDIEELNEWVAEHPGHSTWSSDGMYKLMDFNPPAECTVEFVDKLFGTSTPSLTVMSGKLVGELPVPYADCTFTGWERSGKLVSPTDVVESDWTLFARWQQRIRRQPTEEELSVDVDDIAHASFQWYAVYGSAQHFADWQSTNRSSNSISADTIVFEARVGQALQFDYVVSSERLGDYFSVYVNGSDVSSWSGEESGTFQYEIPSDGTYTLVLRYKKDDDTSAGLDRVVVKNIKVSSPENTLDCTSSSLPMDFVNRNGLYFCKVSYSNTTDVIISDTVSVVRFFDLTVPATGLTALYSPIHLSIPDDDNLFCVLYGKAIEDDRLCLGKVKTVIPARTAVLVMASPGTYTFPRYEADASPLTDNLLHGTLTSVEVDGIDGSVLAFGENLYGIPGFYPYTDATLPASSVWLVLPTGCEVKELHIAMGGTVTDVGELRSESEAGSVYYDLSGRRQTAMHKGLNLIRMSDGSVRKVVER